jgi:predicted phosphodiesterase
MRYGVIADVHANAHALDTALAFLSTQDVDGYLCAGDLVGYGPMPNECVRQVLALPGRCVAGNHDLIALGRLDDERCIPLAKASLRWTRGVLEDDVRELLEDLPLGAGDDGIAVRHGSLSDPQAYVVTDEEARACLEDLERTLPATDVLVLGHTHRPMAFSRHRGALLRSGTGRVDLPHDEPILLNPGAVGQSRSADARARVMVLDTTARGAAGARAARELLPSAPLPPRAPRCGRAPRPAGSVAALRTCHRPPS